MQKKARLKDYSGAIADYEKAIEINPNSQTYYNRGRARSTLKDYSGAIADYTKTIPINPKYLPAYKSRGIVKEIIGNIKGACSDWEEASSHGDKNANKWLKEDCS